MAEKLNETEARQGRSGKPILFVMIAGVVLVVLGYFVIAAVGVSNEPESSLQQTDTVDAPDRQTTDVEGETVTPSEAEPQQNNSVNVPE